MEAFEKELREAFATEIAKTRKKIIAYEEMPHRLARLMPLAVFPGWIPS